MNVLVLVMGGSGTRLGADIPKQYIEINEIPIFEYILEKYNRMDFIDAIVIASNSDWIDYVNNWVKILHTDKVKGVISGGENRSTTIKNSLEFIKTFATENDVVLFHDATHPYVDIEGTKNVINAIKEYGGATLASFNYDTVYNKSEDETAIDVLPRKKIVSGASPEGFIFGIIYPIYANASLEELANMTSAGAIALKNNIPMKVIECDLLNLKITYKKDLILFEKLINSYFFDDFKRENYNIELAKKNILK